MINNKKIIYKIIIFFSILAIILPILTMIIWSFTNNYVWPNLLSESFGLRGWSYVYNNSDRVLGSLKNSILISSLASLTTVILAIPCSKALAFEEFKGKKIIETLIFSPVIIPPISIAMGLNVQFIKWGISGTIFGVVLITIIPCIPYAVRMIKEVFLLIGEKYFYQGKMLGASNFQIILKLIIPMVMPGIISAFMMCYIVSFSQYLLAYLIGGGRIVTFTMEMFPFIQSGDRMMGSVYGIIFIFSTIITLIVMEYILKVVYKSKFEEYSYL